MLSWVIPVDVLLLLFLFLLLLLLLLLLCTRIDTKLVSHVLQDVYKLVRFSGKYRSLFAIWIVSDSLGTLSLPVSSSLLSPSLPPSHPSCPFIHCPSLPPPSLSFLLSPPLTHQSCSWVTQTNPSSCSPPGESCSESTPPHAAAQRRSPPSTSEEMSSSLSAQRKWWAHSCYFALLIYMHFSFSPPPSFLPSFLLPSSCLTISFLPLPHFKLNLPTAQCRRAMETVYSQTFQPR